MSRLPLDPRLPDWTLPNWPKRLTEHLTRLFKEWIATINPYLGPAWEDLRFPAQGINPAGTAAPPAVDDTTWPGMLLFSGSAENIIAGVAQLPHAWERGTSLYPHIHWLKPLADANADGVGWEFRYLVAPIGATLTAYSTFTAGTLVVGDLSHSTVHCMTSFREIVMPDNAQESTCVLWGLRRTGNTDSYGTLTVLMELDFHYRLAKTGTRQEIPD